ncbi:glycosyltransferase [uncultured Chryseobacterium sp.]|uniref:glycosyltransferase n=1 Tax=uncultured Chryseobacterium sp. TaxID=259322 RepID=UPI0025CCF460|nr:glycosyltransferase [uncultured Chryseobacterium sp.]
MISIIISSYQNHYYDQLVANIKESIGNCAYEVIQVCNPGIMGVAKAYNTGAKKANYPFLLFVHEDILFKTPNWGDLLVSHLKEKDTGIIGLAGSSYVPCAPSSWTVSEKYNAVNILQGNKNNKDYTAIRTTVKNKTPVFAVDGVFMAVRKEHYEQFHFNEKLLSGFHGYDLDFSLRMSGKFRNYVVDDILIQHFSGGNLDKTWLDANIKIRRNTPALFQKERDQETEKEAFSGFLNRFFTYYPVNLKNILSTFRFYPEKLNFKNHLKIIYIYINYIRYSSDFNKKLNASAENYQINKSPQQ